MAIIVKINNIDRSSLVVRDTLEIEQILTSQADTARFQYRKYGSRSYVPKINDEIGVFIDADKIFGGTVVDIQEVSLSNPEGLIYDIQATDYTFALDSLLVSKTYVNQNIQQIISDVIANFAPAFTTNNVTSVFVIEKIVFNQVPISTCLKRLADIVRYDWYVDEDKDIHFFSKYTNLAPYNLTDTSGNYVNETLERKIDGKQLANVVKVRGGEYNGALYTDKITVNGPNSKSFKLPYKYANLTIKVNNVAKTVGVDFLDDFNTKDVLYNYNERTIRFQNALNDGDIIEFSGNPKIPVLAVASDAGSIAKYGTKEKLIRELSIEDLNVARKRASAEVAAYKDEISSCTFQTYTPGLRTGMVINLASAKRSANIDFIIRRVHFTARSISDFIYDVELITTKEQGLIELLQKLLEPDPKQADEAEVSEVIKTDDATIAIVELITKQTGSETAYKDNAIVSFLENIQKDPLGPSVEPIWVLGFYFPLSPNDPKRMGLLDYSMKMY